MAATSSYAVEIQAAYRGFDTSRFVKSALSEIMSGNENVEIVARIRNDNPSVVEHVRSINSVSKARRLNGFIEINRNGLGANLRLALSNIMGALNMSGEIAKQRPGINLSYYFRRISPSRWAEKEKMR